MGLFHSQQIFHSEGTFSQSRNFCIVKKFFHSSGNFPQSKNFSTVREFFHSSGNIQHSRISPTMKQFSANIDEKCSPKAKILDPFNAKSYIRTFLALYCLLVTKDHTY